MLPILWLHAALSAHAPSRPPMVRPTPGRARRIDAGEGVISTAIAVLIVASVGALMWVGFQRLWQQTETKTGEQVDQIGG